MEDLKRLVYISTGRKGVMYTLWNEIIVPSQTIVGSDGKPFTSPGWVHHNYVQNLSMTEEVAVEKAKNYADSRKMTYSGIWDSPYNDRASWMDRWGIHFQSKKKNGKLFFIGKTNEEFWKNWKENKDQIKKEGFRVSKFEHPDRHGDNQIDWYVFYTPERKDV